MPYDVEAIRKKLKQSMSGKFNDPFEFRPEKAKSATEPTKYAFFVLPPLCEGDKVVGGTVKKGMENQFFVQHGNHWVNDKPYPCPRVWEGGDCPICQFGFDLLKDEKIKNDDAKRQAVVKQWMPTQYYMMNIFFPNLKTNPEDLRGKVMFYNAPKTVIDICSACLMRDDAGDPESPEAFGVFFDENAGFVFELQVLKQGRQNSYKTSKFRPTPQPMVKNADGSPNPKAIAQLLQMRHNLFDKIETPNMEKINRVYKVMIDGDDSDDDTKNGGFDNDEIAEDKPKVDAPKAGKTDPGTGKTVVTTTAKAGAVTKPKPVTDDDEDVGTILSPVDDDEAPVTKVPTKAAQRSVSAPEPEEDPLAAEAPEPTPAAMKPASAKAASATKPASAKAVSPPVDEDGADINKAEIDNLLGQLEDDD